MTVEPSEQFDGDVYVSIGGARNYGGRKIAALHDPQSIAAPAKPDPHVRLLRKGDLIGVNSNPENYIRSAVARAANPKSGRIVASSRHSA